MKLSLKVEYSCRALAQLARRYDSGRLMHIDELAEAEAIPKNYLVQILSELRCGGLITSRRGKQGGYALVKKPDDISLHAIVSVVDSELLQPDFSSEGESGKAVAAVWAEISETLQSKIKKYTLKAFIDSGGQEMWHI